MSGESESGLGRANQGCPFCKRLIEREDVRVVGEAAAFPDGYPVSVGHTLVMPVRHESSFFALRDEEQLAVWNLVAEIRERLVQERNPSGFNIGLNDGSAAGQTVEHAHVHVIPRYQGDVTDPRGGVRWVKPKKAAYWERGGG